MNEIKVGQWVRWYSFNALYMKIVSVNKLIEHSYESFYTLDDIYKTWLNVNKNLDYDYQGTIEIADHLEDLLEVGDIVHYEQSPYSCGNEIKIIKSDVERLMFKDSVKKGYYKITAIELKENRVIQEVRV